MQNCVSAASQGGLHWTAISSSAWPQIVWKEFLTLSPPDSPPLLFPSQPLRGVNKLHADFLIQQLFPRTGLKEESWKTWMVKNGIFLLWISSDRRIVMG